MKLATSTGDYRLYTSSQEFALEHIRDAGFKYADYSFGMDFCLRNGIYGENFEKYAERIIKHTQEIGIKLVQAHAPMGKPLDKNGGLLEDTLLCVDACGKWGIENLVVHSGYDYGLTPEQTFLKNKEFFMPLLERAEKYGVNILVENFNKMCIDGIYWIDNASDLLKMIECVNHPLFHAVWDVGHANLQEMPQNEELKLLGNHVKALHIQDNMGDDDYHLVPFLGSLNLDSVMHGLMDINYNGYFTFEVGGFFTPAEKRRKFEKDTRLFSAPIELRDAFERYLFALGKCVLQQYNCFED